MTPVIPNVTFNDRVRIEAVVKVVGAEEVGFEESPGEGRRRKLRRGEGRSRRQERWRWEGMRWKWRTSKGSG